MYKELAKWICILGVTPVGLRPPSVTPSNTLTVFTILYVT